MPTRSVFRRLLPAAVLAAVAALVAPGTAIAGPGDYGYLGGPFAPSAATSPTADKPENKLWYTSGGWWGVLWSADANAGAGAFTIQHLETATHTWSSTGVVVDTRVASQTDTLFRTEGGVGKVYILSHAVASANSSATSGNPTTLQRFTLSGSTWSLDPGYPATVSNYSAESTTFDIDANGYVFATFTRNYKVYVAVSTTAVSAGGGLAFGTPFIPAPAGVPVGSGVGVAVKADDISAVTAFQGGKVLMLWSNQNDSNVYYAVHTPGAAATAWAGGVAMGGPKWADDHMNLKSVQNDAEGRVFAAVKTSRSDAWDVTPGDTNVSLLVFKPLQGTWTSYVFGTYADFHTRPVVVIDDAHNTLYLFATGPNVAGARDFEGTVYYKSTSLDNPTFEPGLGTPFIREAASAHLNNASSTRQSVNGTSGLVVLASNQTTKRYWHNELSLGSAVTPVAAFTAIPTSGSAPLATQFTDASSNAPTSWSWNFGDGTAPSTQQNPNHTFTDPGNYQVTLTATNSAGSNTSAATTITVTAQQQPPVASFTQTTNSGPAPLPVQFTDTSTNSPSSWSWNFGDGSAISTEQNPNHTFAAAGTFTVTLTATNAGGSTSANTSITVTQPAAAVLYRVNAGGAIVTDTPGWSEDSTAVPSTLTNAAASYSVAYTGTKTVALTDPSIPAGTPMGLFQSHRYDVSKSATMQWRFPVPASGTYTVKLYFAETWSTGYVVGARVFTVTAEGATVLPSYDTFADVGSVKGVVKTINVPVTDGALDLNFLPIKGNPFVCAIEIAGPVG